MNYLLNKSRLKGLVSCLASVFMAVWLLPGACAEGLSGLASSFSELIRPALIPIEFRLRAPEASSVGWASEVNKWKPAAHPLTGPDRDGIWKVTVELYPGIYQYKYVVDGTRWVLDPSAPTMTDGDYVNSLVIVGTTVEREGMVEYQKRQMRARAKELLPVTGSLPGVSNLYKPFTFCVLGDSRYKASVYRWIAQEAASVRPRFIVNTGDIVGHPNDQDEWNNFIEISSSLGVPQFVAWGNHEFRGKEWIPFLRDLVDYPGNELYYAFSLENSLFIVLNTELHRQRSKITGEQLAWLSRILDGNVADHVFVFLHRPLWAVPHGKHGGDCCDSRPKELKRLVDVLKRGGVTAVFAGHDHLYYRTRKEDIVQVVTGGAGAPLYAGEEKGGFYHYVKVTVDGADVKAQVFGGLKPGSELELKDSFTLGK
ncbi:MAG: metallophosphoesterase [bacterium]|nr:metallophosphoesterase [bacterium]